MTSAGALYLLMFTLLISFIKILTFALWEIPQTTYPLTAYYIFLSTKQHFILCKKNYLRKLEDGKMPKRNYS